jgi:two-component system phosphate regulon sensor histidine kinase PhoR
VVVIHDVSQLRRLERIRTDFVANVSHELRTPLTSIQGYAETLLNGALEDRDASQRFVGKILQQASQLSQLISDLLELSRIESGAVKLNLEPHHINEFREPILSLFGSALEESRLTFEWNAPDDLPLPYVDKRFLEQVFVNLIDNAIKYTPAGGRITVSADAGKSEVIVHVSDTGIGIPSDMLPRIFERFYRVDKARAREMGGTGLGLSIAKHILLQHGGQIWADSVLGKGSVFHFALPIEKSAAAGAFVTEGFNS